jgi:hypothetical protein
MGVTALGHNPAFFAASPLIWDAQLLSGGTFVETDYVFIHHSNVSHLLTTSKSIERFIPEVHLQMSDQHLYYQFVEGQKPMRHNVNAFAGTPAFATRINHKWSAGFYVKMRQAFSVENQDPELSLPILEAWQIPTTKNIAPTNAVGMVWSEYALNIAHTTKISGKSLSIGLNTKLLVGHQGLYVHSPDHLNITKLYDHFMAGEANVEYAFTYLDEEFNLNANGLGLGIDIGVVFSEQDGDHPWRLSAAITDLGAVNFTKHGERHYIRTETNAIIPEPTFDNVNNIREFAAALSNSIYNNPSATLQGNDFGILTPAGFNFNFDMQIANNVFFNGSAVRKFVVNPRQLHKENYLATSIRYETPFLEIGLPLVLYQNNDFRPGAWVRVGPVTIGSDHVGSLFFKQKQLSGSDIYFAIKLNNFNLKSRDKNRNNPEDCFWQ